MRLAIITTHNTLQRQLVDLATRAGEARAGAVRVLPDIAQLVLKLSAALEPPALEQGAQRGFVGGPEAGGERGRRGAEDMAAVIVSGRPYAIIRGRLLCRSLIRRPAGFWPCLIDKNRTWAVRRGLPYDPMNQTFRPAKDDEKPPAGSLRA
ncbi:MAG: hypothetical protein ACOVPA_15055 [Rubrivivax sp.]